MKIKLFTAALAALALIACEKTPTPIVPEEADYVGTVTVESSVGTVENTGARVEFSPSEDGTTADLTLYEISFSPKMPMTLDVIIPGVAVVSTPEKITFSADEIIPFAMGVEFPRYLVTELAGEIVGNKMTFSLKFGGTPTSFVGEK